MPTAEFALRKYIPSAEERQIDTTVTYNERPIGVDILEQALEVVEQAERDTLGRIANPTPEVEQRIHNALEWRFLPYVVESTVIAKQLESQEHKRFIKEIDTFLGAKVGFSLCPDGRISSFAIVDPRVGSINRRLQGLPQTRTSTTNSRPVLNDPDIAASIITEIEERIEEDKNPEIVEFLGPHIHSMDPLHGCGAYKAKIEAKGLTPEIAMKYGGIAEFFEELGDGFYAFNNVIELAGGKGTTFDFVHDAYSQGFIVGLRDQYKNFGNNNSLRANLVRLHEKRKILMTEMLGDVFKQTIFDEAKKLGVENGYLDLSDYTQFGKNARRIGRIAKAITIQEEAKGYKWIPDSIKAGKSEAAVRVLAYHAIRNVVYRVVGNITPENNRLKDHPEKLIRVGPIGADYNIENIPFIQSTPRGRINRYDIEGIQKLYGLTYDILKRQGADLTKEGRIILVSGAFDPTHHSGQRSRRAEFNEIASVIRNNAAHIRRQYMESIQTGQAIVISCLFDPLTRRLTHVLTGQNVVFERKYDASGAIKEESK